MSVQLVHTNKQVMSFRIDPALRLDLDQMARLSDSRVSHVINRALRDHFSRCVSEAEEDYAALTEELSRTGDISEVLRRGQGEPAEIGRLAVGLEELEKSGEFLRMADTFQSLLSVRDLELIDEGGFLAESGRKMLEADLVRAGLTAEWLAEEMPKYGHSGFQEMWEGKKPISFRLLARIDQELMNREE